MKWAEPRVPNSCGLNEIRLATCSARLGGNGLSMVVFIIYCYCYYVWTSADEGSRNSPTQLLDRTGMGSERKCFSNLATSHYLWPWAAGPAQRAGAAAGRRNDLDICKVHLSLLPIFYPSSLQTFVPRHFPHRWQLISSEEIAVRSSVTPTLQVKLR